ncbi:hypothetical protein SAMD00019534_123000 [Acytostelium subglobosum LB1]|uniref:hypothetical protein n=1 Tax=Acytostelium subglobosum LB1 TaxID=1410327 RepID=UPI000645123A|nr:hypothetical protein SAMD00019534_123000 [Acytostelium subglobosum LB1]GAM29124.1 hypothetical protein SAMD00019534_123000 [Acytostelium subglobosum LB1]|eukprot:XP_012747969.1 hypothetical protein SAMD00019534_123000 [Acytostelium subglobosum LB1]
MIKSRILNCIKSGGNELELSQLKLNKFPPELKKPLSKSQQMVIKSLDCSANQLNDLRWDLSSDFDQLESLNVASNPLSSVLMIGLPGAGWLRALSQINLSKCRLTRLGALDLQQMPCLRRINLSSNDIVEINDQAFNGLAQLEDLDLSFNQSLLSLPSSLFHHCAQSLSVLNMAGCQLQSMANIVVFEKLGDLNLSGNSIDEMPESIGRLSRLHTLHLGNNKIKHVPLSIGHCSALRSIVLTGNPIEDYETLGAMTVGNDKLVAFLIQRAGGAIGQSHNSTSLEYGGAKHSRSTSPQNVAVGGYMGSANSSSSSPAINITTSSSPLPITPPHSSSPSPFSLSLSQSPARPGIAASSMAPASPHLTELDVAKEKIYVLIRYDLKANITAMYDKINKAPNIDEMVQLGKIVRTTQADSERLAALLSYKKFHFTMTVSTASLVTTNPQTPDEKFIYLKQLLKSKIEMILVYSRSIIDHLEIFPTTITPSTTPATTTQLLQQHV